MKATYRSSVLTPAGWRSVDVEADVKKISEKRVQVETIMTIDGEIPHRNMSRTGAKRQQYNGMFTVEQELGKIKNISSLKSIGE